MAASPDDIVCISTGEIGLIEIKNLLHSKPINFWQATESKHFCLENVNGKLQLKRNHQYIYQYHGLLNICNKDWIDFVVRTLNPHQIFIERIHRDNGFWDNSMLPKLESFYNKVLLPELASPREGQSPGIRESGIWVRLQIYKYKSGALSLYTCFVTCTCICIIFLYDMR